MHIACLLLDHLPILVEMERTPRFRGQPLLVVMQTGTDRRVLDASPRAVDVWAGMPLAEAQARCKDALFVEADIPAYQGAFEQALDAVEGQALDVEEVRLGLAYVRLDNAAQLFGSTKRVAEAVLNAVPPWLYPRLGIATSKFPAFAAAGLADYGKMRWVDGPIASFLAPLRTSLLPVDFRIVERLYSFGLRTLGQIAKQAPGPLQAQFGPTGRLVWDLAQGVDPRPLLPRRQEEVVEEALTFPSPQASLSALVTAADVLLGRAFSRPALRGRTTRICTLEGIVFRAPSWKRQMVFREPLGDRTKAIALVRHTLEGHPPPGALEDLRLTLSGLAGQAGRQESMFFDIHKRDNLSEALLQLRARLGKEPPIYQVREVEPWSRLPERRMALVPFAL